ncbi:MAG: UbiD family decarboxylase, partial [Armatimonadota bacterium]|nr:UbiD family decarboxylase [Armatimonadota bacterium]
MAYRDLKEFVSLLRERGELKEISLEVDPYLEIAEITDRVVKRGGPALLFTNVRGHRWPVLINAFGTERRMAMALGAESLDAIAADIAELLEPKIPASLLGKLQMLPKLKVFADMAPRSAGSAPCQEVVITENPSLDLLPIIQCWPMDGGPYITLPLVFTRHPELGTRNVGMYRLQKFDAHTLGMHWQRHKGGAQHYRVAERLGRRLEVAIALGPDPAVTYSASAPLPDEVDELMLAGFLRRRPVEVVKCRTVDLEVPALDEIAPGGGLYHAVFIR